MLLCCPEWGCESAAGGRTGFRHFTISRTGEQGLRLLSGARMGRRVKGPGPHGGEQGKRRTAA